MTERYAPASLVVLGASGFVGRAVVAACAGSVTAVRRTPREPDDRNGRIRWLTADLSAGGSLDAVLQPGDVVINLAYARDSAGANLALADNVARACQRRQIARLVHCS